MLPSTGAEKEAISDLINVKNDRYLHIKSALVAQISGSN